MVFVVNHGDLREGAEQKGTASLGYADFKGNAGSPSAWADADAVVYVANPFTKTGYAAVVLKDSEGRPPYGLSSARLLRMLVGDNPLQ